MEQLINSLIMASCEVDTAEVGKIQSKKRSSRLVDYKRSKCRKFQVPRVRFEALFREVLRDSMVGVSFKVQAEAVKLLHESSEEFLTDLFFRANKVRQASGREELGIKHFQCATSL